MFSLLQRHPFIIALSVVAALLLAVIAAETGLGASLRSQVTGIPAKRAAPFEAKLLPAQQVAQAEQLYPEVAARPLFTPTRRPAPAAAPPSTYTPGQFMLQGVIVVGNSRTAMLREKSNGRIHRVEAGREINGIKVAQIDPEAVTLTQGSDREVLSLQVLRPGAVPTPGTPQPAGSNIGPFGPMAPVGAAPTPAGGLPGAGQAPATQPAAAAPPAAPPVPQSPGMVLNAPNPLAAPPPGTNPGAPAASTTPMSPEELLARRRARRGQQSQ